MNILRLVSLILAFEPLAQAATILSFEDFNSMSSNAASISVDAAQEASSLWKDVSGVYNASSAGVDGNARTDFNVSGAQEGFDGTQSVRVRSSNGAMTLDSPLALASSGSTTVTISFNIKLDTDAVYTAGLYYSADAAFTSPVTVATWTSTGSATTWDSESYTLTDGVGGVVFTDDAYFLIGKIANGSGSNPTYHAFDNIEISVVPEPSSLALLSIGCGLFFVRRRCG